MQPTSAASKYTVAHEDANTETRVNDEVVENLHVGSDNGSCVRSVPETEGVRDVIGDVSERVERRRIRSARTARRASHQASKDLIACTCWECLVLLGGVTPAIPAATEPPPASTKPLGTKGHRRSRSYHSPRCHRTRSPPRSSGLVSMWP